MDTSQIRARAREKLKFSWALSIAVAAVAVLLGGVISGTSFLPELEVKIPLPFLEELARKVNEGIKIGRMTLTVRTGIIGIVAFIMGGAVQLGHAQFLLNQHDGKEIQFSDLFSQFYRFGQGFAQKFLRTLFSILWGLCLIIPGTVAAYSYAMTPFLMVDFPELSAQDAISLSKKIMYGHKMELFILDLTFIGWDILCFLAANLGFLLLNPYTSAARAVFYRQLQGGRPPEP